jgi:hypothetical protein
MTDAQEKRLIEASRKVDAHGDVAPAHVQDPMTMVLRNDTEWRCRQGLLA